MEVNFHLPGLRQNFPLNMLFVNFLETQPEFFREGVKIGQYNTIYDIQDYCTYISPDEIWEKYVPMGFRNFKLEGRTGNPFNLVETYCHYMIRPERQGKARLLLLNSLAANKVLTWNYMKPKKWIPE